MYVNYMWDTSYIILGSKIFRKNTELHNIVLPTHTLQLNIGENLARWRVFCSCEDRTILEAITTFAKGMVVQELIDICKTSTYKEIKLMALLLRGR